MHSQDLKKLLSIQVTAALILTLVWALFSGAKGAFSATLGGGIAILPILVFAGIFFRPGNAKTILQRFYLGEGVKWVITGILFWVCIQGLKAEMLPLLVSFGVVQVSLGLGFLSRGQVRK